MLGRLIQQKYICKDVTWEDKKLVNNLNHDGVKFPVLEKDFSKIEKRKFALMCFVMKISWFFKFKFQIKNLKTRWICCLQFMKTSHIKCISKIFTNFVSQNKE